MNNFPVLLSVGLIAFAGLLAVAAVAAFVISLMQQRQYDNASLPELYPEEEEEVLPDDGTEILEESRFDELEETFILEDEESNELMKNIVKAGTVPTENSAAKFVRGLLPRKKETNQQEEGESHADSQ